ncbi:MAG: hypothetical protein U1F43_14685 [Myxococcota bacterium]
MSYAAPTSDVAARPLKSPKVLGILSIIFASITLLGSLMTTCGGLAGNSITDMQLEAGGARIGIDGNELGMSQREIFTMVKDELGGIYTYSAIIGIAFVVMSAWLLALGIGQVGYRRWARGQTVVWGWLAIAVLVAFVVLTIAIIGPAYQHMFDFIGKHAGERGMGGLRMSMGSMGTMASAGAAIFGVFLFLPYPIILLAFFSKDRLKQGMTR